ncbi:hypothetical protein BSL78_10261 [Apostichopus japonicus]|uniref:Uncharacterized protein n=1 Tax=Stichopus japonicus TaxID=307972 RepID=A0A2G8KXV8_STIJA|nr:hypothetical protein BSL78_10261 [Apostichopus japonicus]
MTLVPSTTQSTFSPGSNPYFQRSVGVAPGYILHESNHDIYTHTTDIEGLLEYRIDSTTPPDYPHEISKLRTRPMISVGESGRPAVAFGLRPATLPSARSHDTRANHQATREAFSFPSLSSLLSLMTLVPTNKKHEKPSPFSLLLSLSSLISPFSFLSDRLPLPTVPHEISNSRTRSRSLRVNRAGLPSPSAWPLYPPQGRMTLVPSTKQREKPSLFSLSISLSSLLSLSSPPGVLRMKKLNIWVCR